MNSVNNNLAFTAKFVPVGDINREVFRKSAKYFSEITKDSNDKLFMWKKGDSYVFSLSEPKNANFFETQSVGRDTMGYLLIERTYKNIAEFFKTTLNVLKNKEKALKSGNYNFVNSDIDSAVAYSSDNSIGSSFKMNYNDPVYGNVIDYQKAGQCIHVEG